MSRPVTHLLLSMVIGTANLLTVQAHHDCSMTGRRNSASCCCDSPPVCCKTDSPESSGRDSMPALRSLCCSVSFEKGDSVVCSRNLLEGGWKHVLSGARLSLALSSLLDPIDTSPNPSVDRRRTGVGLRALVSQPPIFLLHCALLL